MQHIFTDLANYQEQEQFNISDETIKADIVDMNDELDMILLEKQVNSHILCIYAT